MIYFLRLFRVNSLERGALSRLNDPEINKFIIIVAWGQIVIHMKIVE